MQPVEIYLETDPFVERTIPEQNIRVKCFYRDLFGGPVRNPSQTNPKKMQELAIVTVLKDMHIPSPHKHKTRYSPKNIKTLQKIPRLLVRFKDRDVSFGPPPKSSGKYMGIEEIYYPKCHADFWTFYGGDPNNYKRIDLIEEGPIQGRHNTNNATAIVKLSKEPVKYLTWLWSALDPREMYYPADLRKVLKQYYQKVRRV